MIKLRYGYVLSGIITGCILLFSFWLTIPDNRLHIVVCDVGQGDAIYIRFPDGRDMLIDGGPSEKVLTCLGKHMPFWDRRIDLVFVTHPQKDHIGGLPAVLSRYGVTNVVRADVTESSDIVRAMDQVIADKKIPIKYVTAGERITVTDTVLSVIWPSAQQVSKYQNVNAFGPCGATAIPPCSDVLGTSGADVNDASLIVALHYGTFDALFMGDADEAVQTQFQGPVFSSNGVFEFLKVPHHGAKTALSDTFLTSLPFASCPFDALRHCSIAAISVGKNTYGHPAPELIKKLEGYGLTVVRTDKSGDIEIISDGVTWEMKEDRQ